MRFCIRITPFFQITAWARFTLLLLAMSNSSCRLYRNQPTKTVQFQEILRVPVNGIPNRVECVKTKPQAKQTCGVQVWEPDMDGGQCCKRNCHVHYFDADHPAVKEARKPLFDGSLTATELRMQLLGNWRRLLLLGDGHPVCLSMACRIYRVSRSRLYPEHSSRTKAESNHNRAVVATSVSSWFESLKEVLDIMPDEGWYLVPHARRRYVYDQYMSDARASPNLRGCNRSYFYQVWRDHHPNVRLRKHCRFTKCAFCVKHRGILWDGSSSVLERSNFRRMLRDHYRWAVVQERGVWKAKQREALEDPDRYLCISLDGTDQFPQGVPHFFEKTKKDDGSRPKLNVTVGVEAGQAPVLFCAWEHFASDSNWTCETLYRMLNRAEQRRGKLPPNLHLQLDNCIRENKNTYVFCYLGWLMERGIFKRISVSFLPVGHTHFINDQVASRISVCVRVSDIKSAQDVEDAFKQCYSPRPEVIWIKEAPMDIKELFNPGTPKWDSAARTARVRPMLGCATKIDDPRYEYMGGTSALHWKIVMLNGVAHVQSKFTCVHELWGQPLECWNENAPRPNGRTFERGRSGLLPSDIRQAHFERIGTNRLAQLKAGIEGVQSRLNSHEKEWLHQLHTFLQNVGTGERVDKPVSHGGTFRVEEVDDDEEEEEDADDQELALPPATLFRSFAQQKRARYNRQIYGYSKNTITIGNFIAYRPNYTEDTPNEKRQDFWVGKVQSLNVAERFVRIKCYHTGAIRNAESNNAVYRMWTGNHQIVDVKMADIYNTFALTSAGRIKKNTLRFITQAISLMEEQKTKVCLFSRMQLSSCR